MAAVFLRCLVGAVRAAAEQADQEPGTLLYAVHRSGDDPNVFWTTEVYADEVAFAAHSSSQAHTAATPIFTELIDPADVLVGQTPMAKGLGSQRTRGGLGPTGQLVVSWPARPPGATCRGRSRAGAGTRWRRRTRCGSRPLRRSRPGSRRCGPARPRPAASGRRSGSCRATAR